MPSIAPLAAAMAVAFSSLTPTLASAELVAPTPKYIHGGASNWPSDVPFPADSRWDPNSPIRGTEGESGIAGNSPKNSYFTIGSPGAEGWTNYFRNTYRIYPRPIGGQVKDWVRSYDTHVIKELYIVAKIDNEAKLHFCVAHKQGSATLEDITSRIMLGCDGMDMDGREFSASGGIVRFTGVGLGAFPERLNPSYLIGRSRGVIFGNSYWFQYRNRVQGAKWWPPELEGVSNEDVIFREERQDYCERVVRSDFRAENNEIFGMGAEESREQVYFQKVFSRHAEDLISGVVSGATPSGEPIDWAIYFKPIVVTKYYMCNNGGGL